METNSTSNKKSLKLKFAALYILSLALVAFIFSVFIPRITSSGTLVNATPLENDGEQGNDLLNKVELINTQYKKLKQLDQEYSGSMIDSADAGGLSNLNSDIIKAEKQFLIKIDSLDAIARAYTDKKSSAKLSDFIESFRLVMNDRASMQAFKTAVFSKGNTNTGQQNMLMMQSEIQARNGRITILEKQIRNLETKKNSALAVPGNTANDQQNMDELNTTIAAQERKIASLTATIASLESDLRSSNIALEQARKTTDNNSSAVRNQTIILEKRINDLNAEIRFAQVDCSIARVDATQIISNARQRKILLADALTTLNNLSATGDATVKRKVSEKIIRLNQVSSTVRD